MENLQNVLDKIKIIIFESDNTLGSSLDEFRLYFGNLFFFKYDFCPHKTLKLCHRR